MRHLILQFRLESYPQRMRLQRRPNSPCESTNYILNELCTRCYISHAILSSYQESKLNVTQCNGRYSQLSWAGQYKKCVQYDFQFTLE